VKLTAGLIWQLGLNWVRKAHGKVVTWPSPILKLITYIYTFGLPHSQLVKRLPYVVETDDAILFLLSEKWACPSSLLAYSRLIPSHTVRAVFTNGLWGSPKVVNVSNQLRMGDGHVTTCHVLFRTQFKPSCQLSPAVNFTCRLHTHNYRPSHLISCPFGTGRCARRAFHRTCAHYWPRARTRCVPHRHCGHTACANKILYVMETRACMCYESVHFYRYD